MKRGRIVLWLVIALSVPAQAMATYGQRLPCFEHAGDATPAAEMDCHSAQPDSTDHSTAPADCCGDSCPDMAACTGSHVVGPSAFTELLADGRSALVATCAGSCGAAFSAPPLRPPASCPD